MRTILNVLEEKLGTPVDIEFASDGRDLYLLQCRPQSSGGDAGRRRSRATSPRTASCSRRAGIVSNGRVPNVTHIVYVDPDRYNEVEDLGDAEGGRPGGGPAQQPASEAAVHPDGARPVGEPWRHQARASTSPTPTSATPALLVEIARKRGGLRAGSLLRHAFLPGPRRVRHPVPSAVSGRRGDRLQRAVLDPLEERAPGHPAGVRFPRGRAACRRRAGGERRPCSVHAHEWRPRRGARASRSARAGFGGRVRTHRDRGVHARSITGAGVCGSPSGSPRISIPRASA